MKKLLLLCLALLPLAVWAQYNTPCIELSMSQDTLVAPDVFHLDIRIIDNKGVGKQGIDEAEKKVLLPTLLREGIDVQKHLVISDITSYYYKNKDVMSKEYTLTLYDTAQVNHIIVQLRNENFVVSLSTEVSNEAEIKRLLQAKALKAAKKEAETLLSAVGCKVGALLNVDLNLLGYFAPDHTYSTIKSSMPQYRKKEISATINVVYGIIE